MNKLKAILTRAVNPLRSRKVRVALATVIAAYLAEYGFEVNEAVVVTIMGVGISVILGIAHEDNGKAKAAAITPIEPVELLEAKGIDESLHEAVAIGNEPLVQQIANLTSRLEATIANTNGKVMPPNSP